MSEFENLSDDLLHRIFRESAEHSALVDEAAAELIVSRGRRDILPIAAELIFRRNRRGEYIHDLVWSFFHDVDASALAIVAGYLLSDNERDVRLACELLHLPESSPDDAASKRAAYERYMAWLGENRPFLYLTGEHFNYTSKPEAVKCDLEAKYLHREISPRDRTPTEPLTDDEREYLAVFRALPETERELLADHSLKLHRGDIHAWHEWLGQSAAEQVMAARATESEAV